MKSIRVSVRACLVLLVLVGPLSLVSLSQRATAPHTIPNAAHRVGLASSPVRALASQSIHLPIIRKCKVRYVDGSVGADSSECTDSGHPCATIQYALNQGRDCEIVLVASGAYTENLVITHPVDLLGGYESGTWRRDLRQFTSIIDGSHKDRVIRVQSGLYCPTTIDGFSLTHGDGGMWITSSSVVITNCKVFDNHVAGYGAGGIHIDRSKVTMTNTSVCRNSPGAMMLASSGSVPGPDTHVSMNSCTVAYNEVTGEDSGAIFVSLSWLDIVNSILWGHQGRDVFTTTWLSVCVRYSDTEQQIDGRCSGGGNISADPRLTEDCHLRSDSPCIDAGDNSEAPLTDWEGDVRPSDGDQDGIAITDMGADEVAMRPSR